MFLDASSIVSSLCLKIFHYFVIMPSIKEEEEIYGQIDQVFSKTLCTSSMEKKIIFLYNVIN